MSFVRLGGGTGPGGFALQNSTPTILSWTAPTDGQLHNVFVNALKHVTSAETGGTTNIYVLDTTGTQQVSHQLIAGGQAAGYYQNGGFEVVLLPGWTVQVVQSAALTAGASVVYVDMQGN